MATILRAGARAAAVLTLSLGLGAVLTSPASAVNKRDDGDMPGDPLSMGQAFLLFVLIPLSVMAIVWLLVAAPGWTRGGRASSTDAWTGDPLVLDASAAPVAVDSTASTALAIEESDGSGGTSARW